MTFVPYSSGNGLYTAFGSVVSGFNVVTNIGAVPTDANGVPLTPVILNSVTILRIGTAASNFNAAAVTPPLPAPRFKASQVVRQPPNLILEWNGLTGYEYRVCYTGDLKNWQGTYLGAWMGASGALTAILDSLPPSSKYQYFILVESNLD